MCEKLEHIDFNTNTLSFIKNLTKSFQHVCVNGTKLDLLNVNQGVPQWTILGPLFFLLYVNKMTNYCNPNSEMIQYDDDTLIFSADKNPFTSNEAIKKQIERLCSYFEKINCNWMPR